MPGNSVGNGTFINVLNVLNACVQQYSVESNKVLRLEKLTIQNLFCCQELIYFFRTSSFNCSVCKDCPPPPTGLAALFASGSCKQRCDLCGFCGVFGTSIGQCKFCVKARGDPSGSKGCTRKCEIGEPLCKGPCKTRC